MNRTSGSSMKTTRPERNAAVRQPSFKTASATRGKIRTPPMACPVWTMDIASPRLRRNQWLTVAMVAWLKPA